MLDQSTLDDIIRRIVEVAHPEEDHSLRVRREGRPEPP